MLTGEQIRGARAMLRWDQAKLANESSVSLPTIKRLEKMAGEVSGNVSTVRAIQAALETAGIEFIDPNGGGPGVRLKSD